MLSTRKLAAVITLLGVIALAAGAVPAFTADNGTVTGSVSVPAPPAPCLMLSTTAVDFGTQPFSDPAAASTPLVTASPAVHATSCSTADENLFIAASAATTASGGTWQVPNPAQRGVHNTCAYGPNVYDPNFFSPVGGGFLYSDPTQIFPSIPAGQGMDVRLAIEMPCRGSVGAGGTASMTFTTTAVLV